MTVFADSNVNVAEKGSSALRFEISSAGESVSYSIALWSSVAAITSWDWP